jgi:hypothetical protein
MKRTPLVALRVVAYLSAGMCGLAAAGEDPRLEYAHALLKQAAKPTAQLKLDESLGHPEVFRVTKAGGKTVIECGSPAGAVYGALAVARDEFVPGAIEKPDFDIRGTTLCLMVVSNTYKVTLSPEVTPWFFDQAFMERTLDSFAAERLNTIFLWTCHLFPYIVELPKYPEATELKPEELRRNQAQFRWFTQECARRNIRVLLHFYNLHLSEPMAKAHNLPANPQAPTPLLKEYTHYVLSRFFEEFDSVGLYICPGESLQMKYQSEWFRDVIFDAASKSGKNPLLVIRDWTLDMEFRQQLRSLYENCYSETKHNQESLTSPVPDRRHEQWKDVLKGHIVNLHGPPMDLEPMRWASPRFIAETVGEWKKLGFLKGAEIYTTIFWQWPYALDKLEPDQKGYKPTGRKLLWLDRDALYLDAFGRYLWKTDRDPQAEQTYWEQYLARKFGSADAGKALYRWYVLTGPISPGMQNLTATRFMNWWPTVMLQNQDVDRILKARQRIDDVPAGLTKATGSDNYYSQPVDTYFFERYKAKYNLPGLAQRVSMPVQQYAEALNDKREVPDAMTPDKVCDLLCQLASESLAAAKTAQTTAGKAAREEAGRFVTDSEMYVLATEALKHKVLAALCKAQMLKSADKSLAASFTKQMEESVAAYEKLAALTDRTYLFGNDLGGTHWKTQGLREFQQDLKTQQAWLAKFTSQAK